MNDLTLLLNRISSGGNIAAGDLLPLVYQELRDVAPRRWRAKRQGKLSPQPRWCMKLTWLRVGGSNQIWQSRAHCFGAAAEAMRRILIDRSRSKRAERHFRRQDGFRAASEAVGSSNLKTVFNKYSLQRRKFAGELQALAHSVGETNPESTGSVAAAMHGGWINLTSAITGQDDHAILAECERGEDLAVAEYRKALESDGLPGNVVQTIQAQFAAVQAAHDQVRDLRHSLASP